MLKLKKKNFIILLIVVFLLGSCLTMGGTTLYLKFRDIKLISNEDYESMTKFVSDFDHLYQADKLASEKFLWDYNTSKIDEKMIKLFIKSLDDPYSQYMNETEYEAWNQDMAGSFYGVGITYQKQGDNYIIVNVLKDTPAEKAGLKVDDIILNVDGKTYKDQLKMQQAIRGPKDSKVTINYLRNGVKMSVEMVREEITIDPVESKILDNNIGYIRIISFDRETAERFESELSEMENKNVKGLVIDLRVNGGGYVNESVEVADMLLPACTITTLKDNKGKKQTLDSKASCTDLPYVVLVDGGTASASEILAGAIQDNKGGKIVGTKTYGKGIVQSTFPLSDGSCIKLTTMEYLTPNGNSLHKKGITPDYVVKLKAGDRTDYQLEKAIKLLTAK